LYYDPSYPCVRLRFLHGSAPRRHRSRRRTNAGQIFTAPDPYSIRLKPALGDDMREWGIEIGGTA
ncbi:MAG: hypothetical protein NDI61_08670, partial [Bdellovibrionaceae bacterium]|nr:hypothetical protein [Pseudobdellovibrionaceae bacterium]